MGLLNNVYSKKEKSFGGGFQLWRMVREVIGSGGTIQGMKTSTYLYPSGTPVEISTDGKAKILEFYKVTLDSATTTVRVMKADALSVPQVGEFLMKAPTTLAGTGKGVTVDAIDSTNAEYHVLTLSGDLGSLVTGDLLCGAAEEGADVSAYAVPNALLRRDVYVEDGAFAGLADGVVRGTVLAERLPFMTDVVKDKLNGIVFDN